MAEASSFPPVISSQLSTGVHILAGSARGGTVSDAFSAAHDYSGGNVAGTMWDGIRYNEGKR